MLDVSYLFIKTYITLWKEKESPVVTLIYSIKKKYLHNIRFYEKERKQFKYMNSSNVTMFEAKLEIYLYPHIRKILQ